MTKTVGVVGLGNMGRGIARNIARAGHSLMVWDVAESARAALAATRPHYDSSRDGGRSGYRDLRRARVRAD